MQNTEKPLTVYNFTTPFWDQVKQVWNHGLFGVDIGSIIVALLIFGFFMFLRDVIAKFVMRRLEHWAERTPSKIDDRILPCLIPPMEFLPITLGVFFAAEYLDLGPDGQLFFSRLVRSMIAFSIFWAVYLGAEPLGHSMKKLEKLLTPMMTQWIFKVMKIIVLFIGGAVILEIWGIEVAPLLAGLGLFGAAIALGAQDFFKNLIAGMSLISEKRFLTGDWILVEGVVEGTVEEIGFRSTMVRRFDKAPIYVPNSKLADAVVTNFSRMTYRRISWTVALDPNATTEQLKIIRDGIMNYVQGNNDFAQEPEVSTTVRIETLGDKSIDFKITCFTRSTVYNDWMKAKEDLALKVKEIVEKQAKTLFVSQTAAPLFIQNLGQNMTAQTDQFAPPVSIKKSGQS